MNIEDEYPSGADELLRKEYEFRKRAQKEQEEMVSNKPSLDALQYDEGKSKKDINRVYETEESSDNDNLEIIKKELEQICNSDSEIKMPDRISLMSTDQPPIFEVEEDRKILKELLAAVWKFSEMPLYTQGYDWHDMRDAFEDTNMKWRHYFSESHTYEDGEYALRHAFEFIEKNEPNAFSASDYKIIIIRISKGFSGKLDLFRKAHKDIEEYLSQCIKSDKFCVIDYAIAEDKELFGTTDLDVDIYSGKIIKY